MIDATFVEAPRQRNSRTENAKVKAGELPDGWDDPEQAAQRRQKDPDARWTQKNDETHYGYQNPINADAATQLLQGHAVTLAPVHDRQVIDDLLDTAPAPPKTASARFTQTAPSALPNGKPLWRTGVWKAKFMKRARGRHH
jgi:IS5 family transposase